MVDGVGDSEMLAGVRVLDLATLATAPLAATYLGEFGADVIKVKQPTGGDPIRNWGNQRDGIGLMWKSVSRNERSVTFDLRVTEGQDLLRRLVAHADVVVANTRPQTLQKWGLDYPRLRAVNKKIVMLHITGYCLTGPEERAAQLRHAGGGDERIRQHHPRGRWSTDAAAVHAGRRCGVAGRRVHGHDGAIPPRCARRSRPVDR